MSSAKTNALNGGIVAGMLPAFALAFGLSVSAPHAHSATLGPISVLSNLGEPLAAEIEIFDLAAEEAEELDVALASEMEFEKAGGTRTSQMESLKLRIVQQGRRRIVQLSTDKPINEPVYGLLLELRTETTSTVAEFAVLPEEAVKPAEAVANAPGAPAQDSAAHDEPAHAAPAPVATAAAADTAQANAEVEVAGKGAENLALQAPDDTQHTVQRGENLTLIARQHSVPASGLDQFITAIYAANPEAFIRQNLHYLKAGAVLALPSEESVSQVDVKAARQQIVAQWQDYQGIVAARETTAGDDAANRSSSKKLATGSAARSSAKGDRLTLAALKRSDADAQGKTEEEAIAARKAAEEASERIRLLEKNILDLKTTVQPPAASSASAEDSDADNSAAASAKFWGILTSPARDLMMQAATVLLLAALVIMGLLKRNNAK